MESSVSDIAIPGRFAGGEKENTSEEKQGEVVLVLNVTGLNGCLWDFELGICTIVHFRDDILNKPECIIVG